MTIFYQITLNPFPLEKKSLSDKSTSSILNRCPKITYVIPAVLSTIAISLNPSPFTSPVILTLVPNPAAVDSSKLDPSEPNIYYLIYTLIYIDIDTIKRI